MTPRRPRSTTANGRGSAEVSETVRRVVVYTRRSTDEEHQPYSIEAQTLRLDSYIASQPGWVKTATFSDNASAKDTRRPGLRAALAAARSGRIDVLLVLKVDRFSRRQRDLVALVEELTTLGVAFVSATEAFDTSTPAGRDRLQPDRHHSPVGPRQAAHDRGVSRRHDHLGARHRTRRQHPEVGRAPGSAPSSPSTGYRRSVCSRAARSSASPVTGRKPARPVLGGTW
jgi:Resolvase, N terminal domain